MSVPPWLDELRKSEITRPVLADLRTEHRDRPLGLTPDRICKDVIGGGQADFESPWTDPDDESRVLSVDDRALLYAYFNQKGHIEELTEAFLQLFGKSPLQPESVVIDLGCGPFTGGLALAAILGPATPFKYVGVDRARSMRRLGKQLAKAAVQLGGMPPIDQQWVADLASVSWPSPPGWSPVLVVASYLLASPTLDPSALVTQLDKLLARIGRGPVTVLYTNAVRSDANANFPVFRAALKATGFKLIKEETGQIQVNGWRGAQFRGLRYALFQRQRQDELKL